MRTHDFLTEFLRLRDRGDCTNAGSAALAGTAVLEFIYSLSLFLLSISLAARHICKKNIHNILDKLIMAHKQQFD